MLSAVLQIELLFIKIDLKYAFIKSIHKFMCKNLKQKQSCIVNKLKFIISNLAKYESAEWIIFAIFAVFVFLKSISVEIVSQLNDTLKFKLLFLTFEESGALVSVPTLCFDISGTSYESNLTSATFCSSYCASSGFAD